MKLNVPGMKVRCHRWLSALSWLALAALVLPSIATFFACVPTTYIPTEPPTTSPWAGKYAMTYNPPEKRAARAVDITIAVVNPAYKGEGLADSSLADPIYGSVGKGFSASMGNDLDKILIAKGVTTIGPFASREEITYNEKKGSAVILAPQVLLTTQIKYSGDFEEIANGPAGNTIPQPKINEFAYKFGDAYEKGGISSEKFKKLAEKWALLISSGMPKDVAKEWAGRFASGELIAGLDSVAKPTVKIAAKKMGPYALPVGAGPNNDQSYGLARFKRDFTMTTSGWMYFILAEPMTGEKLWVKKLELEPIEEKGSEAYAAAIATQEWDDPCAGHIVIPVGLKPGEQPIYNGRADAMATTLQKMYPIMMQKFETYLDSAEIEALKQKGKEIRERKVYAQ